MTSVVDEEAPEQTIRRLGWRVYTTNAPMEQLSLERAAWAYRGQYLIE